MKTLPPDPLAGAGIAEFGARLRRGEITAEAATRGYLARIEVLEPRLNAFVHVAGEQALEAARGIDRLLAAGVDLGPLMGVPVAVKDLFTVAGMPRPRVGTNLDVADLVEPEGTFVKSLKRAGCIVLGTTRMTEFAFGLFNLIHVTPWNPWDAKAHRMPGGSSSGSAVAMAAGLCAFSVGSDTGGSVRQPAALCGTFGFKSTTGLWPTDGVFPLSTTLDSIGTFHASARDAALVFSVLAGKPLPEPRPLKGMRLGKPVNHYFDAMDADVARAIDGALGALRRAGVEIVDFEVPEAVEIDTAFPPLLGNELLAHLGAERVAAGKDKLDPLVKSRLEPAFKQVAIDYIRARNRQRALVRIAEERMRGLDAWVVPTALNTAVAAAECGTVETAGAWTRRSTNNTRPGNLFGQCGASLPVPGAALPVGLQLMCAPGREAALLSVAQAAEELIGRPARPDLSGFL